MSTIKSEKPIDYQCVACGIIHNKFIDNFTPVNFSNNMILEKTPKFILHDRRGKSGKIVTVCNHQLCIDIYDILARNNHI
jgi:hypothetical protein